MAAVAATSVSRETSALLTAGFPQPSTAAVPFQAQIGRSEPWKTWGKLPNGGARTQPGSRAA
jgi:hypothetical protein